MNAAPQCLLRDQAMGQPQGIDQPIEIAAVGELVEVDSGFLIGFRARGG